LAKYNALGQEDGEEDLELGEGPGLRGNEDELGRVPEREQITGVVPVDAAPKTVEEELDNWDENIPDEAWDDEDDDGQGHGTKVTPATSEGGSEEVAPVKKVAVD
jgi:hypothetical protein